MTDCPPIEHAVYIAAAPRRVWVALTSAGGWDAWFTRGAEIDPQPGGRIVLRWSEWGPDRQSVEDEGVVLDAEPEERFAFRWRVGESSTTVLLRLEPRGAGCVVRVTESGYSLSQADLAAMVGCATGWAEALTLLKFFLEHGLVYGDVPPPGLQSDIVA